MLLQGKNNLLCECIEDKKPSCCLLVDQVLDSNQPCSTYVQHVSNNVANSVLLRFPPTCLANENQQKVGFFMFQNNISSFGN